MKYIHTKNDGGVAITVLIPVRIIKNDTQEEFQVFGVIRKDNQTFLSAERFDFPVGDASYDIGELTTDHIPDYTIVFPDIETEVKAKWVGPLKENVVSTRQIEKSESIPTDRYFRNAWVDNGKDKIEVDMPKAREVHKEVLRLLREPKLAQLDVEYMQADEAKDNTKKAEITAKKQELRDITDDPRIESAQTPEELKLVGEELL